METAQVLEYFGYKPEEVKTLDDLKTKFESDFVRTSTLHKDHDIVKKFTGSTLGGIETETIRIAKQYGLEKDEFLSSKENKVTDKFEYVLKKQTESLTAIQKELEGKLALNSDEKVKEFSTKYEKEVNKRKEIEGLLETTKKTLEEKEEFFNGEIKNTKLSIQKKDLISKINWADGVDDLKKEGFLSRLEKAYAFDLGDQDEFFVIDKTTKEKLKSTKTVGTFKSPIEVIEEEGVKAGVWKVNKDAGKKIQVFKQPEATQTATAPGRKINPLAI